MIASSKILPEKFSDLEIITLPLVKTEISVSPPPMLQTNAALLAALSLIPPKAER